MTPAAVQAFDSLAQRYDELWTNTAVGRSQRAAVWEHIDPLFHCRDRILDLGCGTGEDALHLMQSAIRVHAVDQSEEMVRIACDRGVDAQALPIERLDELDGPFDGAISNFGALNCVADLEAVAHALSRVIRPGGYLAICLIGRFCPWETAWYSAQGNVRKAFRRWRGQSYSASLGITVYYPSAAKIVKGFRSDFELKFWAGIGLFVPPSYVSPGEQAVARLERLDRTLAHLPLFRAAADHRLFVFQRK